jgi:hypothetical protein
MPEEEEGEEDVKGYSHIIRLLDFMVKILTRYIMHPDESKCNP